MSNQTACAGGELSPTEAGMMSVMVLHRFLDQVEWRAIVDVYLSGLVNDEDRALITEAIQGLVKGGIEFVGTTTER